MRYAPPGALVDLGGFRLHLLSAGEGAPAVVFDAALGASSLSWSLVQPQVAAFTRTCSYDRAGFGWSDGGPMPRTAGRVADELHQLLGRAKVPPPYLLVGHSYGALVSRIFAARHRNEVAGVILAEPAFPEDWLEPTDLERRRVAQGVRLCHYGSAAARLGIARLVSLLVRTGALGAARALVGLVSRGELKRDAEQVIGPIWRLPPGERGVVHRFWTRSAFFDALGSQIGTIQESAREVVAAGPVGDVPLTIVSATEPGPDHARLQEQLAHTSPRGRRVIASASGHWVPLDQPDVIVSAICEMVDRIRAAGSGSNASR